ncbi:MAG: hypothetical protein ACFKPT_12905 [Gloeotrichia echinulata GP01]
MLYRTIEAWGEPAEIDHALGAQSLAPLQIIDVLQRFAEIDHALGAQSLAPLQIIDVLQIFFELV